MNHLLTAKALRNRYFVLRHGESMPNVMGIIVSHISSGKSRTYGLSERGRRQVEDSARAHRMLGCDTVIVSSDFSRAMETARIARRVFGSGPVRISRRLRERFFGDHEGRKNDRYEHVWSKDAQNPTHTDDHVESVEHVLARATALVVGLERHLRGKKIVLVAHGDTLQILQTGFAKISPSQHRSLKHIDTAEIRELHLKK